MEIYSMALNSNSICLIIVAIIIIGVIGYEIGRLIGANYKDVRCDKCHRIHTEQRR